MTSDWELFQKRAQLIGAVLAVILNSLVIHLVLKKSPKNLGVYKYLIIFTAAFEMAFAYLDIIVQPIFHSIGSTFVIIVNVQDSYLSWNIHMVLISLYCGFFGSLLALFSIQFLYRYWVVSGNKWLKSFKGFKILWWLLIPLISGSIWGFAAYFPCSPRPSSNEYMRHSFKEIFGLTVEQNVYVAPYFFEKHQNGTVQIYYPSFIAIIVDLTIINISNFTAFYYGFKCYHTLHTFNEVLPTSSQSYRNLQNQLFYSLVAQTMIPIFLMHIPVSTMFFCTFLEANVGHLTGIVTITIALFPAIDPLPTLFIVKNYRVALKNYIGLFLYKIAKVCLESADSTETGTDINPRAT